LKAVIIIMEIIAAVEEEGVVAVTTVGVETEVETIVVAVEE